MDCGCMFMLVSWGLGLLLLFGGIMSLFDGNPHNYSVGFIITGLILILAPFGAMALVSRAEDRRRHFK